VKTERAQIALNALKRGIAAKKVARYLFATAPVRNRHMTLQRILHELTERADQLDHNYRLQVITPYPLSASQVGQLVRSARAAGRKNIIIEQRVQPRLKGGVIALHKGERVDYTISGRLKKMELALWRM